MKQYKSVIFDLFNTVILWNPNKIPTFTWERKKIRSTNKATYEALAEYREAVSFSDYHNTCQKITGILEDIKKKTNKEVSSTDRFSLVLRSLDFVDSETVEKLAKKIASTHMQLLANAIFIPSNHISELRRIHNGYRIGLLSNFDDSKTAHQILKKTEIEIFFNSVLISEQIGVRKPSSQIFSAALSSLQAIPEETLFIGDSWEEDVMGATQNGMDAVWINKDPSKITDLNQRPLTEPTIRGLTSITELSNLLPNSA